MVHYGKWVFTLVVLQLLSGQILHALDDDGFIRRICQSTEEHVHVFYLTGRLLDWIVGTWSEVIEFDLELGWTRAFEESSDVLLRELIHESLPDTPMFPSGMFIKLYFYFVEKIPIYKAKF